MMMMAMTIMMMMMMMMMMTMTMIMMMMRNNFRCCAVTFDADWQYLSMLRSNFRTQANIHVDNVAL